VTDRENKSYAVPRLLEFIVMVLPLSEAVTGDELEFSAVTIWDAMLCVVLPGPNPPDAVKPLTETLTVPPSGIVVVPVHVLDPS
jgi:hypothetical protein